ncbi:MAG: alpha/beta fold hydrolase, partial [Thermoleophilaceae bacterium]
MRTGRFVVGVLAAALIAACSHHRHESAPVPPAARLSAARPCLGAGVTCARLDVPLDHSGRTPGRLSLRVAIAGGAAAPRGTLVWLTGGPGETGVPFIRRVGRELRTALRGYRVVMLDQRGTSAGALRCPALQRAVGASDLTVPPAGAVESCARLLGPRRRFFTTADTVADLDQLRAALGVRRWTLDGVSYGTFVAERYALAHPQRIQRLVLDSVVPQTGINPFQLETIQAVPRVLRSACAQTRCGTDPAADLAAVVRSRHDGPALLDTLVTLSIVDPRYRPVPRALHAARQGRAARLDHLIAAVRRGNRFPAGFLSQGLHASTVCSDFPQLWGGPPTPRAARAPAVRAAADRLTAAQLWPFDRATATGNGELLACERWPPVPVTPPAASSPLPRVPVLLLAGDRDLSTPLAWPQSEARLAPLGRLVVVHGAGHSVQLRTAVAAGRRAVARFLQQALKPP